MGDGRRSDESVGMALGGGCLFGTIGALALTAGCAGLPEMQGEAGLGCLAAFPFGGAVGATIGFFVGRAAGRRRHAKRRAARSMLPTPPRPDHDG
jgi:membrane protein DedA with SNARE-associated domain